MDSSQYLELFISEAHELLNTMNQGFIQLEKKPKDVNTVNELFRASHTLKGNAAAMGFEKVVRLAHAMENALSLIREGDLYFSSHVATDLLKAVDKLETLVDKIQTNELDDVDEAPMVERLHALKNEVRKMDVSEKKINEAPTSEAHEDKKITPNLKYVRINLARLDALMNLVGELHLSKLRLMQLSKHSHNEALTKHVNDLERIINQLQNETMQMRLLPLQYLFNYYPRLIRDDAEKEGKEVELSFSGADIGVDRMILDEINDPLLHLLRNALTHGIESPESRETLGKPRKGQIQVKACREQNQVVIEVEDDGAGINLDLLKNKILKKGVMDQEGFAKLSEPEQLMMITHAGLSLREDVNERAGRGMGMSVVKRKIDAVGGNLSIQSHLGKGSIFTLRLPISMAIIHALLIRLENEVVAIPLYYILEAVNVGKESIRYLTHQAFFSYRGEVIPLIDLGHALQFTSTTDDVRTRDRFSVVVCQIDQHKLGLIVDAFLGEQEVVIKTLETSIQSLDVYSGATLLADGRVAMILDVSTLIHHIEKA